MLPEIGELVFSFVIGYMGALEFLYVVRHLYHWGFRHNPEMRDYKTEAESLLKLQEQLKIAIAEAKEREEMGMKAMKDGVVYKDGFRIDEDKKKIEELKEKIRIQEQVLERQREIEEELERQRKIEEETRQQLKKAEEELRRMEEEKKREKQKAEEEKRKAEEKKRKAEEEAERKLEEEKRKAEEAELKRKQAEEEENNRKILEAERKREEEQRRQEEEIENQKKLLQAEKEREEKQRQLEIEAEKAREQRLQEIEDERIFQKLLEDEREREEKQRQLEIEAETKRQEEEQLQKLLEAEKEREQRLQEIEDERIVQKLLEAERAREAAELESQAAGEREIAAKLIAAEQEALRKQREEEENEENVRSLLEAERELELKQLEMEEEAANLQRLIEAEREMEERQRQLDLEALEKLKHAQEETELKASAVEEEAFIKKEISQADQSVPQSIKTQFGQSVSESLKPKTILFPGVSEESTSADPFSSKQSSFSTQLSSDAAPTDLHFDEYERQAPDGGEDMPSLQYSDDYLRSLDGIKNKPLVREDGSGRRRAFKKRRSSGSSTSSRDSRASREEELKMFTSLEEEEFENIRKGESEYDAIKYASEPTLKVHNKRRHKRSPAKDGSEKGSLEMLDEEESNPWGEVKPENYKNTEFWKREKNLSIDEEQEEYDAQQRIQSPNPAVRNLPKMSSFEEATKSQHEEAISALKRQRSKDPEPIEEPDEEQSEIKNVSKDAQGRISPAGSNSSPASASASALQSPQAKRESSLESEDCSARTTSPGMRRSPRVDEMKEYEEKWKSEDRKARAEVGETPQIEIHNASDEEPMSPEFLLEGISDFYDFNASINPRRSRSRSKTPALNRSVSLPERRTPSPLNSFHIPARSESRSPSPDPASYKFIVQRIIPRLDQSEQPSKLELHDHGLSDFYDFNTKLNQDALDGVSKRRYSEVHRTSIDFVLEDLKNDASTGAIAKKLSELKASPTTPEYERSISAEMKDIQKLKEEIMSGSFKRSTYVGESMDFSDELEGLREEAKNFRRSRSKSRSPEDIREMKARLLARQQLQNQILDDITKSSQDSQDFSEEITKNTVDRNRRASDTALIQKPEILFQIQDMIEETDENFNLIDCDPEEYHHFRRFSLGQEIPVEQYPEDYTYISEIEIRPLADLETLMGDSEVETVEKDEEVIREEAIEEAYESGSDDERQTVVEVDDEIDEDIFEFNEKSAEESHNEQSECEEADREVDRYAGRNADDWRDLEEGAVGGISDEDSFQIDRIYDEAIKNRKPSGILRDYDCILKEIQISDADRFEEEDLIQDISYPNGNSSRNNDPGVFSPRSRSSRGSSRDSSRSLIDYERRDTEMRYLADPTLSAINSTRLRSRYGIVPSTSLPTGFEDDTTDVDLNYKPKKEYNWRKNFKLDDDTDDQQNKNDTNQYLDTRKFSLGGESITLFSQSPEKRTEDENNEIIEEEQIDEKMDDEPEEVEKLSSSKKKKNRRKSRKGSKGSIGAIELSEEKENDVQQVSVNEEKESSKRKHRREAKKTTETATATASAGQEDAPKENEENDSSQARKKLKKHKKAKEEQIVLPKLDIILPTPEKKAPPPSVAALRAALSAPPPPPPPPPTEKKPLLEVKPKKLWEKPSIISDKKSPISANIPSPIEESKLIPPSNVRSTVSPQPATIETSIISSEKPTSEETLKENGVSTLKIEESTKIEVNNTEISSLQTVAFTLETRSLTLTKDENHQNSEMKDNKVSEVQNAINQNEEATQTKISADNVSEINSNPNPTPETIKSELSIPQSISESSQNPSLNSKTVQNSNAVADQKQNTKINLEPDILLDGGLYPLF